MKYYPPLSTYMTQTRSTDRKEKNKHEEDLPWLETTVLTFTFSNPAFFNADRIAAH